MATKKLKEILEEVNKNERIEIQKYLTSKDILEIETIIDVIMLKISILQGKQLDEVQYEIEKQQAIYFFGLLQCTSFEIEEEDIDITNYNLKLEEMILQNSYEARKIKETVENIIQRRELGVVEELSNQFKNFPTVEETKELEKNLDNIFSKRNSGDLKIIDDILKYNDPSLKLIKDVLSNTSKQIEKEVKKNGDNIT